MTEKDFYQPNLDNNSNSISHNFSHSTNSVKSQKGRENTKEKESFNSKESFKKIEQISPNVTKELSSTEISSYNEETIHKTILVGDSGVGKTSILVQFDQGKFQSGSFSATVGIGFTNKIVTIDNKKCKLQIWDTAGQERFRSVTHAYYRDAQALLLLYDVTNQSSFDNIRAWLSEIKQYAEDDVVIMLLGNKVDKPNRVITKEQGEKLAKQYEVSFMETSAKTGQNVELAFMAVARALISKQMNIYSNQSGSKFNLAEYIETNKEQKKWCCSS